MTSASDRNLSARISFAAIVLAMLPAVLDQTILSTALPTIAGDLGRLADVSWVTSVYVVAAAASTPLWGKLGDRHGRKLLLEIALALFLASSAVCGLAQTITWLIVSRTVQGVAAGGLMTLAMAAVADLVSPRERGRYQGYIAATFAVATVVGPLLGGLLVQHGSWRWVFYINLPLGAVALAGLRAAAPASEVERGGKALDVAGAALLTGSTAALMLTCIWGGERYAWSSVTILSLIAGAILLALGLVARERRATDPIVPLDLMRTRPVVVSSAALFLTTAALFSITVFVPLYLQAITGATPTEAGLLLVPMMLGLTLSTNLAGRQIARTGRYKRYPIIGLGLMTVALSLMAIVVSHPSKAVIGIVLAVFGFGFGMVGQVLIVAVQNSVERRRLGIAMATTSFFRGLGGAFGAAALGAVFAAHTGTTIASVSMLGATGRSDVIDGVRAVFLVAAPIAAIALLITLVLREVPLKQGTGAPRSREHTRARQGRSLLS